MKKATVEIFRYKNSNEYTKQKVYPVVEEAPFLHPGAFQYIPHRRTVTKHSKFDKYPRTVPVPIKYKIVTTSGWGQVNVQKIEDDVCESPIKLFAQVVGVAEQDALATVCGSEYKQKMHKMRTAQIALDNWTREWKEKNHKTIG
jgi:hypothetical protein